MALHVWKRVGSSLRQVVDAARKRTLLLLGAVSLVIGLAAGTALGTTVYGSRTVEPLYRADHGHILAWIDNTADEVRGRIHRHTSSHTYVSSPPYYLKLRVHIEQAGLLCASSSTKINSTTVNYMTHKVAWPRTVSGANVCPAGNYYGKSSGAFYDPGAPSDYDADIAKTPLLRMPS